MCIPQFRWYWGKAWFSLPSQWPPQKNTQKNVFSVDPTCGTWKVCWDVLTKAKPPNSWNEALTGITLTFSPKSVWRFKFLGSLDYLGWGRASKKSTLVSDQRTVFRVCASSEINILVSMVAYRHKMDSKERLRSMKNLSVWCRRLWQCFMMFDVGSFFLLILMVLLMVDGMGRRGCPWVNESSINPRVGALHQYLHKFILSGMVRSYMCIPSLFKVKYPTYGRGISRLPASSLGSQ